MSISRLDEDEARFPLLFLPTQQFLPRGFHSSGLGLKKFRSGPNRISITRMSVDDDRQQRRLAAEMALPTMFSS